MFSKAYYAKLGAYSSPFSGQGIPFYPLGVQPGARVLVHEVGFLAARPYWNYFRVLSPFWRLYYDMEAGHKVFFPETGRAVTLGPAHLVLIPDHQMFHTQGNEPRAKLWLHFTCARRVHPAQALPIVLRLSACEREVLRELAGLLKSKKTRSATPRVLPVGLALLHLALSRPEIRWLEEKPGHLAELLRYIEQHYREPLSNPVLARLARVSERSLTRDFLRYQGVSPRHFLMQVRVRAATDLMLSGSASLAEIADQTGFPNRAYLTRVFTKITGVSPARFRRTRGTAGATAPAQST
ncbi:MAG: AraC family transcriptional regulator [Kiritimatiellia bacterium]|jgi:AraC-like DNA-binding protein|nr:AraC family transcriptional regulator [Kiritimatiellia bacterium]